MKKIAFMLSFCSLFSLSASAQTEVKFYTTMGDFLVELSDSLAPITTTNFKNLVKEKYYDGVIFHRVIDNFMIQGGQGAPGKPAIQDEFHDSLSNVKGTISMANAGPNTGTTQFFINLVDNTRLDHNKPPSSSKHPVFGKVTENFSVVQAIGKVPKNGSKPITDVVMDSLRIMPDLTSIAQNSMNSSLQKLVCYPNPLQHNSVINIGQTQKATTLNLYNTIGNKVAFINLKPGVENELPFNALYDNELNPGIYFLEAINNSERKVIRIIVK